MTDFGSFCFGMIVGFFINFIAWSITMRLNEKKAMREVEQDRLSRFSDVVPRIINVPDLPDEVRPLLEVHVVDWGPDFTGEDGVLGRWRWSIWEQNRAEQEAEVVIGQTHPYFLGNEKTSAAAERAARAWIMKNLDPADVLFVHPQSRSER